MTLVPHHESDVEFLRVFNEGRRDIRRDLGAPISVVNTWLITYNLLCKNSRYRHTKALFCFIVCFDRQSIKKDLVFTAMDELMSETVEDNVLAVPFTKFESDGAIANLNSLALLS